MHISKWTLASMYYLATYPYRCRRVRALEEAGQAPIGVIVFHRVADDRANDWTTSTSAFKQALHH